MSVRALLRPLRRFWPQKVRTRLTVIYAALFFAAGLALLGLTYGLVASNLPAHSSAAATVSKQGLNTLNNECNAWTRRSPPSAGSSPTPHTSCAHRSP